MPYLDCRSSVAGKAADMNTECDMLNSKLSIIKSVPRELRPRFECSSSVPPASRTELQSAMPGRATSLSFTMYPSHRAHSDEDMPARSPQTRASAKAPSQITLTHETWRQALAGRLVSPVRNQAPPVSPAFVLFRLDSAEHSHQQHRASEGLDGGRGQ